MGRRLSFWLAVAGVSILANYAVEAAAPLSPGLARFTAKLHQGAHQGAHALCLVPFPCR